MESLFEFAQHIKHNSNDQVKTQVLPTCTFHLWCSSQAKNEILPQFLLSFCSTDEYSLIEQANSSSFFGKKLCISTTLYFCEPNNEIGWKKAVLISSSKNSIIKFNQFHGSPMVQPFMPCTAQIALSASSIQYRPYPTQTELSMSSTDGLGVTLSWSRNRPLSPPEI